MINKNLLIQKLLKTILLSCLLFWNTQSRIVLADTHSSHLDSQPAETTEVKSILLWKRSFEEIKAKAEAGDAYAQAVLAERYMNGIETKIDYKEAKRWAEESDFYNHPLGGFMMAYLYVKGRGVKKDFYKADLFFVKTFTKIVALAEQGNAIAENNLGILFWIGAIVKKDSKIAFEWFQKSADQGYADAQNYLAGMYDLDKDTERDYTAAFYFYKRAAEKGHAHAQYNLGVMYKFGYGIAKNYEKAVFWYRKAAIKGQVSAQNNYGHMLRMGYGTNQDYKKAIMWFKKAAEQGNGLAYRNLGFMYKKGYGVKKDCLLSTRLYRKAIKLGDFKSKGYLKQNKQKCN